MVTKRNATKFRRAFRLAPIAASLATLAMVAACARTNGKAKISTETQAKVAKAASKLVSDYDMYAPENMQLAARFGGASIVLIHRLATSVDAKVKIVFADQKDKKQDDLIFMARLPLGKDFDSNSSIQFLKDPATGADDQHFVIKGFCANADCLAIDILILEQGEDHTVAAATTATLPAPNAPAADGSKGKINMAGVVTGDTAPAPTDAPAVPAPAAPVVPPPAAAQAEASTAPPVVTPKKLITIAKDVLIFSITDHGVKSESANDKATRRNVMDLIGSGTVAPAPSTTGPIVSYEVAYQAKYGEPAPAETAVDSTVPTPEDAAKADAAKADAAKADAAKADAAKADAAKADAAKADAAKADAAKADAAKADAAKADAAALQ
jgi:hypothetical protein